MHLPQFKQKTASSHDFAMVPRNDVPRSSFRMKKTVKTAFDAGYLVPFLCEEVLPGDTFNARATIFARLATPIFPFMDNLTLESFFFFVPNRLVWDNWVKFMGEQANPADSISFTVPIATSPAGGYAVSSLQDYLGLPTVGQVTAGQAFNHSQLPLRAYNLIWNQWFRDENLQNSAVVDVDDGPDTVTDYVLKRRGKRHDYFTSCLPWTQKGSSAVTLPLGTSAPVSLFSTGTAFQVRGGSGALTALKVPSSLGSDPVQTVGTTTSGSNLNFGADGTSFPAVDGVADLSTATAATINSIRLAFQTQRFLEKDARGGTRYIELIRSHFGVISPDARLQRPEYLGGGKSPIVVNPVVQTGQTGLTGGSTALGTLSGVAAVVGNHGFTQSFTEHGYIIGMCCVDADLTYQQGLRRHWSRSTRYDFYWPVFQALGEQAVLRQEIYCTGVDADDATVFGYQERWAEYRYNPSEITGLMRSTAAGTIDPWHLSQKFTAAPTLNSTFIESTPPVSRVVAVGAGANGQQLLMDVFFDINAARPLPMYSVPGMVDHF